MEVVERQNGGVFFLYGYGGTGRTSMLNTLVASLCDKHIIILPITSSGIENLLLPGGRTTHSRLKIPIPTLESSICNIDKKDDLDDLLRLTNLILRDEVPMANKFYFEAINKSLKDIMSEIPQAYKKLFGGKVVVFGGDFRQIQCRVLKLTKNMRLQSGASTSNQEDVLIF